MTTADAMRTAGSLLSQIRADAKPRAATRQIYLLSDREIDAGFLFNREVALDQTLSGYKNILFSLIRGSFGEAVVHLVLT